MPGGVALAVHAPDDRTQMAYLAATSDGRRVYLNRLSDHLFVLSRWVNDRGARDVLWVPGANR